MIGSSVETSDKINNVDEKKDFVIHIRTDDSNNSSNSDAVNSPVPLAASLSSDALNEFLPSITPVFDSKERSMKQVESEKAEISAVTTDSQIQNTSSQLINSSGEKKDKIDNGDEKKDFVIRVKADESSSSSNSNVRVSSAPVATLPTIPAVKTIEVLCSSDSDSDSENESQERKKESKKKEKFMRHSATYPSVDQNNPVVNDELNNLSQTTTFSSPGGSSSSYSSTPESSNWRRFVGWFSYKLSWGSRPESPINTASSVSSAQSSVTPESGIFSKLFGWVGGLFRWH